MFLKHIGAFVVASTLVFGAYDKAEAATVAVDTELALLIDVSGSVSDSEYTLQRSGYVNAFNDADVQAAILGGTLGKIAVSAVVWAGSGQQTQKLGWTLIDSIASAQAFATSLSTMTRSFSGSTAPGSAINFISNPGTTSVSFSENAFDGTRNVIDVSGDGAENAGLDTSTARDNALNLYGVTTINGIAITTTQSVVDFYNNDIKGGSNAFVLQTTNFIDFEGAVKRKLIAEIGGTTPDPIPLPAAGWLLIAGMGGLAALRRRQTKAA
jgi:hypothetical protein